MMQQLFQSGDIVFLFLAVMAAEALFFARHAKRFPSILTGLCAGASLVLALRAALLDQGWEMIAVFMTVGGLFHAVEVWQWLRLARNG